MTFFWRGVKWAFIIRSKSLGRGILLDRVQSFANQP